MTVDRLVGVVRTFELSTWVFFEWTRASSWLDNRACPWQRITTGRIHTWDHASREQRSALFTRPLIASKHALRITRLRNRPQDRELTDGWRNETGQTQHTRRGETMLMPAGFGSGWVSCSELFTLPLRGPSTCLFMQDNADYSRCPRDDSHLQRNFVTSITWENSHMQFIKSPFHLRLTRFFSFYLFCKLYFTHIMLIICSPWYLQRRYIRI